MWRGARLAGEWNPERAIRDRDPGQGAFLDSRDGCPTVGCPLATVPDRQPFTALPGRCIHTSPVRAAQELLPAPPGALAAPSPRHRGPLHSQRGIRTRFHSQAGRGDGEGKALKKQDGRMLGPKEQQTC